MCVIAAGSKSDGQKSPSDSVFLRMDEIPYIREDRSECDTHTSKTISHVQNLCSDENSDWSDSQRDERHIFTAHCYQSFSLTIKIFCLPKNKPDT